MSKSRDNKKLVVGLDIGTSKIAAIVAEITPEGGFEIIGMGTCPARGLKKGVVVRHGVTNFHEQPSNAIIDNDDLGGSHLCSDGVIKLEKERSKLVETPAPGQKFVSRVRRGVEDTIDTGLFERIGVRPRIAATSGAMASAPSSSSVAPSGEMWVRTATAHGAALAARPTPAPRAFQNKAAPAEPQSTLLSTLLYLFGKKVGTTTLFALDANDNVIANVTVTVTDEQGRFVPNLTRDDFELYEDGRERCLFVLFFDAQQVLRQVSHLPRL